MTGSCILFPWMDSWWRWDREITGDGNNSSASIRRNQEREQKSWWCLPNSSSSIKVIWQYHVFSTLISLLQILFTFTQITLTQINTPQAYCYAAYIIMSIKYLNTKIKALSPVNIAEAQLPLEQPNIFWTWFQKIHSARSKSTRTCTHKKGKIRLKGWGTQMAVTLVNDCYLHMLPFCLHFCCVDPERRV